MGLTTSRPSSYHIVECHKNLGVALCKLRFYVDITMAIGERTRSYTGSGLATCWPILNPSPLLSLDFPYGPLSLPACSYIAGCFRLVTQSAATCSNWFLARGFFTLKMKTIRSSETSVHTRSTLRHIPEDGISHSHRRENLRSYENKMVGPRSAHGVMRHAYKIWGRNLMGGGVGCEVVR
jgi:hypothetical protein